jgi:hypothetical protein
MKIFICSNVLIISQFHPNMEEVAFKELAMLYEQMTAEQKLKQEFNKASTRLKELEREWNLLLSKGNSEAFCIEIWKNNGLLKEYEEIKTILEVNCKNQDDQIKAIAEKRTMLAAKIDMSEPIAKNIEPIHRVKFLVRIFVSFSFNSNFAKQYTDVSGQTRMRSARPVLNFSALEDKVNSFFPEQMKFRIRHGQNVIGSDEELFFAYGMAHVILIRINTFFSIKRITCLKVTQRKTASFSLLTSLEIINRKNGKSKKSRMTSLITTLAMSGVRQRFCGLKQVQISLAGETGDK